MPSSGVRVAPGAERNGALVSRLGVLHPKGNGAHAGAVLARKALRERIGLGVDDEVDAALAVQGDVFVAVPGNRLEAHAFEHRAHRGRVGCGVFDEFEAVSAHGVVPGLAFFEEDRSGFRLAHASLRTMTKSALPILCLCGRSIFQRIEAYMAQLAL